MPTSQNIAHALDEGRSSNGAAPPRRYPALGVVIQNAGSGQLQRILADEGELRSRCEEEGLDYQTARSMIDRELDRRQRQIRPLVAASYEFASAKAEMSRELAARFSPAFNQFYESLGRCEECGVPFDLRKRKRFCSDAPAARHRMRGREKVGKWKICVRECTSASRQESDSSPVELPSRQSRTRDSTLPPSEFASRFSRRSSQTWWSENSPR